MCLANIQSTLNNKTFKPVVLIGQRNDPQNSNLQNQQVLDLAQQQMGANNDKNSANQIQSLLQNMVRLQQSNLGRNDIDKRSSDATVTSVPDQNSLLQSFLSHQQFGAQALVDSAA